MPASLIDVPPPACQYRILIAGGCYGGLSAAINLLEKCDTIDSPISLDITIVDERDGYCTFCPNAPAICGCTDVNA